MEYVTRVLEDFQGFVGFCSLLELQSASKDFVGLSLQSNRMPSDLYDSASWLCWSQTVLNNSCCCPCSYRVKALGCKSAVDV